MAEASHPVSYYTALSPSELHSEIDRETQLLFGLTDQLDEAVERRNEIREAIAKEWSIEELRTLQRDREKRIERLRGQIAELQTRIADQRRRVIILRRRISTIEARLHVPATRSNYFRLMRRIREFRRILRRYPPPSVETKLYYRGLIQEHLSWMRDIRTLRILYRRLGGYQSAISRWNATIASRQRSITQYERWQRVRVETVERLRRLREQLHPWIDEIIRLREQITLIEAELEKKRSALKVLLCRVSLNLYLIVDAGEHEYPRMSSRYYTYRKPKGGIRRGRVTRRYPKGAFQSWLECDAFVDPETKEIIQDKEPFPTLLDLMRKDVAQEFEEEFSLSHVDPDTLTLGEVSEIASPEEIGKPPYKSRVERTVDTKPRETWSTDVNRYLMTDKEYDELTRNMTEYRQYLEAMMRQTLDVY